MRKFLLAAVTAVAVAGSAVAASAAPAQPEPAAAQPAAAEPFKLDDAQMDTVSAGLIGDLNFAIVIPVQIVTVNTLAIALGDGSVSNAITNLIVEQNTQVIQRIRNRNR